eukprot:sb/3470510/
MLMWFFDNPPGFAGWFLSPLSNNTVVMATELVTMATGMLKVIRKFQQTFTGSSKRAPSRRYRLTNDYFDVHLQLIIEMTRVKLGDAVTPPLGPHEARQRSSRSCHHQGSAKLDNHKRHSVMFLKSSEISVRIKIDIVTALHHIGNYGGLGGSFFLPQTVKAALREEFATDKWTTKAVGAILENLSKKLRFSNYVKIAPMVNCM